MEEKKHILIVEDERAIVEILKFNLMREGRSRRLTASSGSSWRRRKTRI